MSVSKNSLRRRFLKRAAATGGVMLAGSTGLFAARSRADVPVRYPESFRSKRPSKAPAHTVRYSHRPEFL